MNNKTKLIFGSILIISAGLSVIDKIISYKTYKKLKLIDRRMKKYSWEYYE
jgi:hypothetical protein